MSHDKITFRSANSEATKYAIECKPTKSSAVSSSQGKIFKLAIRSSLTQVALSQITTSPSPTPPDNITCLPYTIVQGASTWGVHLTHSGTATIDMNCNWEGEAKSAEWTCTGARRGPHSSPGSTASQTETLKSNERSGVGSFVTATVVGAPHGFGSKTTAAPATTSTSTIPPQEISGPAVPGPLPTGALASMNVAAGLLAAALVL